jgi:branched-subunit amino acid transport protein
MSTWGLIALVAVVTVVLKGLGPAVLGARPLPPPVLRVVALLAAPLVGALVVTTALADGTRLHVGADTAGVLVAGVLLLRRVPVLAAVLVAVVTTALLRASGLAD